MCAIFCAGASLTTIEDVARRRGHRNEGLLAPYQQSTINTQVIDKTDDRDPAIPITMHHRPEFKAETQDMAGITQVGT